MANTDFKIDAKDFLASLSQYDKEVIKALEDAVRECAFGIEGDAKAACPVDTGRLMGSITTDYQGLEAEVGTNVEYAAAVEYGTYKSKAQPFLRPALDKRLPKLEKDIQNALGGK